jgi:hypothetical protein
VLVEVARHRAKGGGVRSAKQLANLKLMPKGVAPPHTIADPDYALSKARAVKLERLRIRRERESALAHAALIEQQLRRVNDPDKPKLQVSTVMEQIRERAMTAIELADIQARENGHAHGLASLLAQDLLRAPTATLTAWSKFLPAGGQTEGSSANQHLDAVRALTMAATAAGRTAQIAADIVERGQKPEISLEAVDIQDIHRDIHRVEQTGCAGRKGITNEEGRDCADAIPARE